jgi:hypothetical protein
MLINAVTRIPANPPMKKRASNHQAETMGHLRIGWLSSRRCATTCIVWQL